MVNRLDLAALRPDEHQLEPKPVLPAHDFLLLLVIVSRCAQVTEDELRNPHVVLGVLLHIHPVSVVEHRDGSVIGDGHTDVGHRAGTRRLICDKLAHADDVVAAVHDALVEELVEARNVVNILTDNLIVLEYEHLLFHILDRPYVGVRVVEDVLLVRLLLIFLREVSHFDMYTYLWRSILNSILLL